MADTVKAGVDDLADTSKNLDTRIDEGADSVQVPENWIGFAFFASACALLIPFPSTETQSLCCMGIDLCKHML